MSDNDSHASPLELEEHHVGERTGPLSKDEREYVESLEEARIGFLTAETADEFLSRPSFRPRQRNQWARWSLGLGMAAAVAASVMMVFVPQERADTIRLRGAGEFTVVVLRDGVQSTADVALGARDGDKLRFRIRAAAPGVYVVGFLDRAGRYEELMKQRFDRSGAAFFDGAVALDSEPLNGTLVAGPELDIRKYVEDHSSDVSIGRIEVTWD